MLVVDSSNLWYWTCIVESSSRIPTRQTPAIGFAWDSLSDQSGMDTEKVFGLVCPVRRIREHSG